MNLAKVHFAPPIQIIRENSRPFFYIRVKNLNMEFNDQSYDVIGAAMEQWQMAGTERVQDIIAGGAVE